MNGFEVFGNVILLTTAEKTLRVREAVGAEVGKDLAWGACLLPEDRGLAFKVLGMTSELVRGKIRDFWKTARKIVTGHELPPEFLWR